MPPTLYIKNALKLAEDGIGDGTVYYTGNVANAAAIDQASRTFDLTPITKIADLPAIVDDALNGHILYFPASGNKYHVVDFVASTEKVTTWETPQLTDLGACEIRRALVDNKALAGNPTHRLADGKRHSKYKSSGFSKIKIHLPNMIDNGGFETGTFSGWAIIAGAPTVNSITPMLGSYDAKMGAGDRLWASVKGPIKKTRYRVLFKASSSAWVANSMNILIVTQGFNFVIPATTLNNSSGSILPSTWMPGLTTSPAWHFADFDITTEQASGAWLSFNNLGTAAGITLDEVYVFQVVNPGALIVFDEDNSSANYMSVTGYNAASDRTGMVSGVDYSEIRALSAIPTRSVAEFTPAIYPVYEIANGALSMNASEILLSEKWAWLHGPNRGNLDFNAVKYEESEFKTRSGIRQVIRHSQATSFKDTYPSVPDADKARLLNDFKPHHKDVHHPFALVKQAGDAPILVTDEGDFGLPHKSINPDWTFNFKEVL